MTIRFAVCGLAAGMAVGSSAGAATIDHVPTEPKRLTRVGTSTNNLGSFNIVINAGTTLGNNPEALAAFNRAAAKWESRISDSITVNITADLADLGDPSVIGEASNVMLATGYTTVRNLMAQDAADEGVDDAIVAALPTSANFNVLLPLGRARTANVAGSKANFKALGFSNLDAQFGAEDGVIEFNEQFSFDYDNRDGVDSDKVDFETVAAHEIGHVLGFTSAVDLLDEGAGMVTPSTLDLFRFEDGNPTSDPANAAEFATKSRSLRPGVDEIFDDTLNEYGMSAGFFTGDGRQASHWKDNDLTQSLIGIMDPTLGEGQIFQITEADFRAFDLIGYDISPVPEPGALGVLALAGALMLRRRPRVAA